MNFSLKHCHWKEDDTLDETKCYKVSIVSTSEPLEHDKAHGVQVLWGNVASPMPGEGELHAGHETKCRCNYGKVRIHAVNCHATATLVECDP